MHPVQVLERASGVILAEHHMVLVQAVAGHASVEYCSSLSVPRSPAVELARRVPCASVSIPGS